MQVNKDIVNAARCFAPLAGKEPKVLILGTMPGKASLEKRQYYGYKYNAFWKLMFDILGVPPGKSYKDRTKLLKSGSVALWDVISSCQRKGSSDTAIKNTIYNDISGFLDKHKSIKAVFLNGKAAHKAFIKAVSGKTGAKVFAMPSTSPANTVKYAVKLEKWKKIKDFI